MGNIIPSLKVKHNGNHEIWLVYIVCPICQKCTGLYTCTRCGAGTGDYGVARDMDLPWSAETLEVLENEFERIDRALPELGLLENRGKWEDVLKEYGTMWKDVMKA